MFKKKMLVSLGILTSSVMLLTACSEEVKDDINLKETYESELNDEEKSKFQKAQEENEKSKTRYSFIYDEDFRDYFNLTIKSASEGAFAYVNLIEPARKVKEGSDPDNPEYEEFYIYPNIDNKSNYPNLDKIVENIYLVQESTDFIINYDTSRLIEEDIEIYESIREMAMKINEINDDVYQLYMKNKDAKHARSFFLELSDSLAILETTTSKSVLEFEKYLEKNNGIDFALYNDEDTDMEDIKKQAENAGYEVRDNIYKQTKKKASEIQKEEIEKEKEEREKEQSSNKNNVNTDENTLENEVNETSETVESTMQ